MLSTLAAAGVLVLTAVFVIGGVKGVVDANRTGRTLKGIASGQPVYRLSNPARFRAAVRARVLLLALVALGGLFTALEVFRSG